MKSTQKGFIIPLIIIIVAVLAIGAGIYIHSQNKKATEQAQLNTDVSVTDSDGSVQPLKDFKATSSINASVSSAQNNSNAPANSSKGNSSADKEWKTYIDSSLGILFNFPASFGTPTPRQLSTSNEIEFSNGFVVRRGVYYNQSLGRNLTFAEITTPLPYQTVKPISVSGISAVKLSGASTGLVEDTVYIPVGNEVVTIDDSWKVSENEQMSIFDQIVSSFKITTPNTDFLPTSLGQCVTTKVAKIGNRLVDSTTGANIANSGSSINYTNGGFQVSYYQVSGIDNSRVGDDVSLCLIAIPRDCPVGDNRGKVYKGTNLRTNETWQEADASHSCGGA